MTRIIGLSGGIGSGKSTVTRMLQQLGAITVCADEIVHELQAPGAPLLGEIAAVFGEGVISEDGSLNREALGAIVFRDPDARGQLGKLMHPPVIGEMMRRAKAAVDASAPMVVLDIPLLFEGQKSGTGSAAVMSWEATVLVWVPPEVQIERTMDRDGCDRGEAERRVAAQLPIDEKKAMATHVIDNSGTLEQTREQVEALYRQLVSTGAAS
jgi:dephospho-CoA kinase